MKSKTLTVISLLLCTTYVFFQGIKSIKSKVKKAKQDYNNLWKNIDCLYNLNNSNVRRIIANDKKQSGHIDYLYNHLKKRKPDFTYSERGVSIIDERAIR